MQRFKNIYFLALSTFQETIRNRILWAIVSLAIILSLLNIVFTTLFTWDLGKVSIEFGLSAIAITGLLLVFFLGIKILSDDLERNRIYMIMSRPVTGWQYITGKYFGLAITLFFSTAIMGLSATLSMKYTIWKYAAFIPQNFSWLTYFMALFCQLMSLLIVLAFSFLCYCYASNSFVSVLFSVLIYFVGQNMELLRKVVIENPYAGIVSGHKKIYLLLSWIFPNLSYFDKKTVAAYGLPFTVGEFFLLVIYCILYCSIMLFLSTIFFNRRELS